MRSFIPKLPAIPPGGDAGKASRFVPAAQEAVKSQIEAITGMPTASDHAPAVRGLKDHAQRSADNTTRATHHQVQKAGKSATKQMARRGRAPQTGGSDSGGSSSGGSSSGGSTGGGQNTGGGSGSGSGGLAVTLDASLRDKLLDAVKHGMQMFMLQAYLRDLTIMSVSALGTPGCLSGPNLESYITSAPSVASLTGEAGDIRDAVAEGVSDNVESWQDMVTVPGLPWYPAFSAWPGPQAPPTPNVPTPLISLVSARVSKISSPGELKSSIVSSLDSSLAGQSGMSAFCQNIASCLALSFNAWLAGTNVQLVMGYGPVPSFSPPYVPVGPVVNGDNIAAPGHIAAGSFTIIRIPLT